MTSPIYQYTYDNLDLATAHFIGHTLPTRFVVENVARGTITEVMYHDLAIDSEIDDRIFSIRTLEQKRPIPSSR